MVLHGAESRPADGHVAGVQQREHTACELRVFLEHARESRLQATQHIIPPRHIDASGQPAGADVVYRFQQCVQVTSRRLVKLRKGLGGTACDPWIRVRQAGECEGAALRHACVRLEGCHEHAPSLRRRRVVPLISGSWRSCRIQLLRAVDQGLDVRGSRGSLRPLLREQVQGIHDYAASTRKHHAQRGHELLVVARVQQPLARRLDAAAQPAKCSGQGCATRVGFREAREHGSAGGRDWRVPALRPTSNRAVPPG